MINGSDLLAAGWPAGPVIGAGLAAAQRLAATGQDNEQILSLLGQVAANPSGFVEDEMLGGVADAWLALRPTSNPSHSSDLRAEPVPVQIWGAELIESEARVQMDRAARLPIARQGALMADAHVGYGLPIGGVLATEGAVIPYAVGVDIACRMKLSVCDVSPYLLEQKRKRFEAALLEQTRFGMGADWSKSERPLHPVLDAPEWEALPLLRQLKDKAWTQLGTSGGGNHFVEWGILTVDNLIEDLALQPGKYLALLSHSGSRGLGATIAQEYTTIARQRHARLDKKYQELAWLGLDGEAGQAYWLAMNLAGRYASANHAVIHERVLAAAGLTAVATVENHHNFAWKEQLADGSEVIVHRKGATPAGAGVLGVIPGSMGDPAYVVRGLGTAVSLNSASHGAGRRLGRNQALNTLEPKRWQEYLRKQQVTLLGGSLDESPQAYKNIDTVMAAQQDLVVAVAQFMPRIVRMADDKKSRGRDKKQKRHRKR